MTFLLSAFTGFCGGYAVKRYFAAKQSTERLKEAMRKQEWTGDYLTWLSK